MKSTKPSIPPDFSIRSIMLPTKIAKAKVFNIHASESSEVKSETTPLKESSSAKSFKTMTPKTIPPKSDKSTFREYSAKAIASRDGRSEIDEGSMWYLSKLVR